MQCSICNKMFAASLSVCPSCGAMQTQHNQAESSLRLLSIEKINTSDLQLEIEDSVPADAVSRQTENDFYGNTEHQQIRRGQTTTLLEFPNKMSKDQEWREEIKNRIRERQEGGSSTIGDAGASVRKTARTGQSAESSLVINLKPKLAEKQNSKAKDVVAEALKRIERSRQKFDNEEAIADDLVKMALPTVPENAPPKQSENSNSPLTLVPARKVLPMIEDDALKTGEDKQPPAKTLQKSVFTVPLTVPTGAQPKPKNETARESSLSLGDLDDDDAIAASLQSIRKTSVKLTPVNEEELTREHNSAAGNAAYRQSNEDYAPLAPRFIAGLVDTLICAAGALALSHFAFGALTATTSWVLTAITFAAILFAYLTAALQLAETTPGLRLFRLFVVTAENGEAPTLSQTAISNGVYLLTLATGGIGLVTVFFSSEWRTIHDLLSGTVVVKE